jgi:flagellar FliJ protein
MARFRFPLEALLTARRHSEWGRQLVVADLQRRRLDLEDALRRDQQFIGDGKRSLRDGLTGLLDVTALRGHAGSTIQLMRRANRILLELAGIHRRLESARVDLVEAARGRRAVELLRERRFAAWKRKIGRAEDAAMDELAVQAAARREPAP